MRRDLDSFVCAYPCCAELEIARFDGRCKCWCCGRWVQAVHDCDEDDCYDYVAVDEDEGDHWWPPRSPP